MPASPQAEGGMDAAIVELDALADPVGPAAQDHDLAAPGGSALVLGPLAEEARLVAAVHIRRAGLELGGAGVDPLVDRADAQPGTAAAHLGLRQSGQTSEPRIREALGLERQEGLGIVGQTAARRTCASIRTISSICARNQGS